MSLDGFDSHGCTKSKIIIMERTEYEKRVQDRSYIRYLIGLFVRWKEWITYNRAVKIARKRGAIVGENVVMPIEWAKRVNSNVKIGNNVSIQTSQIDTRSPIEIGNNVIIGSGTQIITTSHNIDSEEWEHKYYGLVIRDYVWIPTKCLILPSCREIGSGAVIGSGSVVVKNVDDMAVVSGNPAKEFKKRKCVHSKLVVESLLGGDYKTYKAVRKNKR